MKQRRSSRVSFHLHIRRCTTITRRSSHTCQEERRGLRRSSKLERTKTNTMLETHMRRRRQSRRWWRERDDSGRTAYGGEGREGQQMVASLNACQSIVMVAMEDNRWWLKRLSVLDLGLE